MRHDFRHSGWGHNMDAKMVGDTLEGFTWSTPQMRKDDELVWQTEYGYAVGKVIAAHPYLDPPDMTRFSAEIIERHLSEKTKAMLAAGEVDSPPWPVVE